VYGPMRFCMQPMQFLQSSRGKTSCSEAEKHAFSLFGHVPNAYSQGWTALGVRLLQYQDPLSSHRDRGSAVVTCLLGYSRHPLVSAVSREMLRDLDSFAIRFQSVDRNM